MKFYFGIENSRDLKVSSSVADKGLNLLKIAPWNVPLVGLRTIVQPGYDSYMGSIASYMKATELGRTKAISSLGNATQLPFSDCLPIDLPPVFIFIKKGNLASKLLGEHKAQELFSRKNGTGYSVEFSKDLVGLSRSANIIPDEFPPSRHIRPMDLVPVIKILQIFSSFLRTHLYPAFSQDLQPAPLPEDEEKGYSYKRTAENARLSEDKKVVKIEKTEFGDFHSVYAPANVSETSDMKIIFRVAKPTISSVLPWGLPVDLPSTPGIHFPFESDLAQPDQFSVPEVLERFFISSLHNDPEHSLPAYDNVVKCWKSTICRTHFGHVMSHMAKLFLVSASAQARVFPIVSHKEYLGSYLSGASYSVGHKGLVYKPSSYADAHKELDCYISNDTVLTKIAVLLASAKDKQQKIIECGGSVRKLALLLEKNYSLTDGQKEKVIALACQLRPEKPYFAITTKTLEQAMIAITEGRDLSKDEPMYPTHIFSLSDPFIRVMAAFGPNIPSFEIPGAPVWKVSESFPEKMSGPFAVKLCSMEVAKSEWFGIRESRTIHNAPQRISAIYEHVVIKGKEDKSSLWKNLFDWVESKDKIRTVEGVKEGVSAPGGDEGKIFGDEVLGIVGF